MNKTVLVTLIALLIIGLFLFDSTGMAIRGGTNKAVRPLILVHGHSAAAIGSMNPLKTKLSIDGYYVDKGKVNLLSSGVIIAKKTIPVVGKDSPVVDNTPNSWPKNSVVTMDYYQGGLSGIPTYAGRLKEVVDIVKVNTGSSKVDIVAHSMGGLVSREYVRVYGRGNTVNTLITLGTPNHGDDSARVRAVCPQVEQECRDLYTGSDFLARLNAGDETPYSIKYTTIAGDILDGTGTDGLIKVGTVSLMGATNHVRIGVTHNDLIIPPNPQVYNILVSKLVGSRGTRKIAAKIATARKTITPRTKTTRRARFISWARSLWIR